MIDLSGVTFPPFLLLDTSIQIDFLRKRKTRIDVVSQLLQRKVRLFASVINYAEVCSGLRAQEEQEAMQFLQSLEHLPVTLAIAERGGFMRRDLRKRGLTFHLPDILIAATAIEHGLSILTDNQRDFKSTGASLFPLHELSIP